MKKIIALLLAISMMAVVVAGCGSTDGGEVPEGNQGNSQSVVMVADVGGVNDQSYNQGAWEGLQAFEEETGIKASFIETVQMSDLATNFDRAVDGEHSLIWGIGFNTADPLEASAKMNPELNYAIVDHDFGGEILDNVTSAMFDVEEASFIVGYIAGLTTETNKVAYIGGARSPVMDLFEYGFRAGAEYAAAELGKEIVVEVQIAENFGDAAKGKAIAASLYNGGSDIIFVAAGATGNGVIEQAIEEDKWVIGVDRDQSYLAPENVLTSALKHVAVVTEDLSKRVLEGEELGGQIIKYGLENEGVGIPENNPNMDPQVYEKAMEIQDLIVNGEIDPPHDEATYTEFGK
ncbi:MAG: BMP family ABC transporter substrate-binding protein [Tissierella sp.]|nr:BMP family ABC transporter substrate-binding protein [Tissierella sp.]